ncbi:MAG TPA: SIS domain-containing protein [Thermoclostridium sp.]|nr:SIS domain-containing protein [Thermoclostridium sp.]
MISQNHVDALDIFLETTLAEITKLNGILNYNFYKKAVDIILNVEQNNGRIHITGIGKPGHVASYIASLMSSTGTSTYELHGTEAVHGSSGQVKPGDIVIAISNSGETAELKKTIETLKNNGAKIIGVSGNLVSWLAKNCDVFLYAGVSKEGGPLNRAPRTSIIAEIIVLQGLSVILQSIKKITPQQYINWHPSGTLGCQDNNEI